MVKITAVLMLIVDAETRATAAIPQMQVSGKPAQFGTISRARDARQIQLSLRLSF
jgi:hypothetical protein